MNPFRVVARLFANWAIRRRAVRTGHPINLWLDDERQAPANWYWATTVGEAQDVLETFEVERMSLDHDLGSNHRTGYDLVQWLTVWREEAGIDFWPNDRPRVHSQNPVGRQRMHEDIERWGRYGRSTPHWHHTLIGGV